MQLRGAVRLRRATAATDLQRVCCTPRVAVMCPLSLDDAYVGHARTGTEVTGAPGGRAWWRAWCESAV